MQDTKLSVTISTTSDQGIQKIDFNESQGMVEIRVRCVPKSIFYKNTKDVSYETTSSDRISQVKIGDRIVWANGEKISPLTSNLYAAYNPYIGDMSADGKVVQALNMTAYTGNFKNELQTSQEPYAWKMIFENNFSSNREKAFEERLKQYAYLYLSQIGNLGDDVVFQTGENIDFQLIAEDFPKNIPDGSRITLKLSLIDKDGNTHEVQNEVALDVDWGTKYMLGVSGNAKDGYHLGQVISPE